MCNTWIDTYKYCGRCGKRVGFFTRKLKPMVPHPTLAAVQMAKDELRKRYTIETREGIVRELSMGVRHWDVVVVPGLEQIRFLAISQTNGEMVFYMEDGTLAPLPQWATVSSLPFRPVNMGAIPEPGTDEAAP